MCMACRAGISYGGVRECTLHKNTPLETDPGAKQSHSVRLSEAIKVGVAMGLLREASEFEIKDKGVITKGKMYIAEINTVAARRLEQAGATVMKVSKGWYHILINGGSTYE